MNISIIVFPGSNCDKDVKNSIINTTKVNPKLVWYQDDIPSNSELIIIPGGFSYGDYLRSGAIASKSYIMKKIISLSKKGLPIIGICNGFQILTEANLLPGTLVLNTNLKFVCKNVDLKIINNSSIFSNCFDNNEVIRLPIAHKIGNFRINQIDLKNLIDCNQIIMQYCSEDGSCIEKFNPNGSMHNIAGIMNKKGNILGMMPHPERHYGSQNIDFYMKKIINSIT